MTGLLHKTTTGMPQFNKIHVKRCLDCLLGKIKRLIFPRKLSQKATQLLEIVHVDLYVPMPTTSIGGNKYSMIYSNDWSQWRNVTCFLKKRDSAREFMLFKARVEKLYLKRSYKLRIVQRDRGDLTSNDFKHRLVIEGIELNRMT